MNSVHLIGRLATEPVRLADTQNSNKRAAFRLAIQRPGRDAGADFLWVTCWNGTADAVMQYRVKGDEVAVDGSLRANRVEQGDLRYDKVEVSAQRVHFLRRKNTEATPIAEPSVDELATVGSPAEDDIPF